MPRRAARLLALVSLVSMGGCRTVVWLGEDRDEGVALDAASSEAGRPDAPPLRDAGRDADSWELDSAVDAADVGPDAFVVPTCATHETEITGARVGVATEAASLASSGTGARLRFGILLPAAARLTGDETQLVLLDRDGARVGERLIAVLDAGGAPSSAATLHSLSPHTVDEGFLLLTETSIALLDHDGATVGLETPLAAPPSRARQREAGWIDDDRFVFIDASGRITVFDRVSRSVDVAPIDVSGRARVLVDPGGVTVTSEGMPNELVVYAADLTGAEALRTSWSDEGSMPIGYRLLGTNFSPTQRTWLIRATGEFRATLKSYAVPSMGEPVLGPSWLGVGPFPTIALEGQLVAIVDSGSRLTLFSFSTGSFDETGIVVGAAAAFEPERDGRHSAAVWVGPGSAGTSLLLRCRLGS
jgi:hypothetical protein